MEDTVPLKPLASLLLESPPLALIVLKFHCFLVRVFKTRAANRKQQQLSNPDGFNETNAKLAGLINTRI